MATITAHCLIKNEENFVWYAIKSVVDFVDKIIVFDTGSTDKTVELIKKLAEEYPEKIIFEEKGSCDKVRHTHLRQEMLKKTNTDWFMILDGDEVWTKRGAEEAIKIISENKVNIIETFFYECVGDIYHTHIKSGYKTVRFVKCGGVQWKGEYGIDTLVSQKTQQGAISQNDAVLKNKFWHLTHLRRSDKDDDEYSSGGNRKFKRRLTYFMIGKTIVEPVPEVFQNKNDYRMNVMTSFVNFVALIFSSNK